MGHHDHYHHKGKEVRVCTKVDSSGSGKKTRQNKKTTTTAKRRKEPSTLAGECPQSVSQCRTNRRPLSSMAYLIAFEGKEREKERKNKKR